MADQSKSHDHAPGPIAANRVHRTQDRERTMRMLKRIADTLGRPVEDFFKTDADGGVRKTDGATGT